MLTNNVSDVITIVRSLIKDQLRTDGRKIFSFDSSYRFTLPKNRVSETSIRVEVNGEALDDEDWFYDSDTNQVVIDFDTSGEDLENEDTVGIFFSYYNKYSDDELQGYIDASLAYFVQHRYKKTFYVSSSDTILAYSDESPEKKELLFIAIIAAIVIDPQNIEINTPDFKLTANRETSDQAQISRAFMQFQRWAGEAFLHELWSEVDGDSCHEC